MNNRPYAVLPRDNRGTEIQTGQIVAYNISGQVALGRISEVTRSYRYSSPGWTIRVELLHAAAGKHSGHYSTVRNPLNLLVLLKGDAPL